jgi:tRNA threonylcarbamoyladenosine modification (KEOPS) complex Cgi121 subunit
LETIDLGDGWAALIAGLELAPEVDPLNLLEEARQEGWELQLFNPRYVAGRRHLEELVKQCYEARRRGLLYASKIGIDLAVRVACDLQIGRALRKVGVASGMRQVVAVALGPHGSLKDLAEWLLVRGRFTAEPLEAGPERIEALLRGYEISREALSSLNRTASEGLARLLAERAALLVGER